MQRTTSAIFKGIIWGISQVWQYNKEAESIGERPRFRIKPIFQLEKIHSPFIQGTRLSINVDIFN